MTINFLHIYTGYRTDKEVTGAMVKECFEIVPQAFDFFVSIRDRMTTHGKPLMILPAGIKKACTLFEYDALYIKFSYEVDSDKFPSYLVHELGEADYLSRGFPKTIDEEERDFAPRIIECFSHPHCRSVATTWGLSNIEGEFRSEMEIEALIKKDYVKDYPYEWECIMMIVWAISTYPELYDQRAEMKGYEIHKDIIEELLSIIQSVNTLNDTPQEVFACMESVVEKLETQGMPPIKVQYPF
ncbi:hypothetical protein DFQ01_1284 [Paenibacillus cellulosilyticus]|uniref:Uncharacterized protein n=1 Tax=Paenibacillus cellulosilyticus TaxID=375489 RepID=A0A2V2YVZ9_9BACL|nr:hypothetical protein [Paenibacillus cellulosilyticus]PWV95292.1 hypothetical protein DFQ01_1284 [Paenibacillus cellulosilyticus]QKS44087.1 hypothetical protein HUB94_06335 [Paenibacillus cellulosilyticus]